MPEVAKEESVLAKSELINIRLGSLKSALSEMFERLPQDASVTEGRPQQPNVLDEILANQDESLKRVEGIFAIVGQIKERLM